MILGEVIPQCMERMLDGYLIELAGRKGFDVDIDTLKENIIKKGGLVLPLIDSEWQAG